MSNTELIKELRALTQAGMKDCKSALEEANWDLQKAVDIVKVKGQNIVSGREGKVASEGLVAILSAPVSGKDVPTRHLNAMVEVNCQTDFVANSPAFKEFVNFTSQVIVLCAGFNEPFDSSHFQVEEKRQELVTTTKENVVVRRWWVEEAMSPAARVFTYKHSNDKIGVLLTLLAPSAEAANSPEFAQLGEDLAMQVAAMNPSAVSIDRLDPEVVARQQSIFETQLVELKKPQAAWPKILEGKFNKWHTDVCLLNQESVMVPKTTVAQVAKNVGDKLGGAIQVVNFIRCQVGEGMEQKQSNFAEEVAKMM